MANLENPIYWQKLINQSLVRYFILKVLRDHQIHGYVLGELINKYSRGYCNPTEGTLYPALGEMSRGGYVKIKTEGKRKVYQVTDKGKSAYRVAAKCWGEIIPLMQKASII